MQELEQDPKVISAAHGLLVPGETVLWASAQRGLGLRAMLAVGAVFLAYLVVSALLAKGNLIATLWVFAIFSFFLISWLREMFARSFVATDRRVIFLSRIKPFRSSYWNYSELDVHWIRFGKGRNIIHLLALKRGLPNWVPRGAVYPNYVENVPGIESVREFILQQIAHKPAPVEEPAKLRKARGPSPRIHGTRSG